MCLQHFFILRTTERRISNVHRSSWQIPFILIIFQRNLNILDKFSEIFKDHISWNSVQWKRVAPCGQTDRRTNSRDKTNSLFSQFFNASKNEKIIKSNSWLRAPLNNFVKPYIAWNPVETNNAQHPLNYITHFINSSCIDIHL